MNGRQHILDELQSDWAGLPAHKRHAYFYLLLVLVTVAAARWQHFTADPAEANQMVNQTREIKEKVSVDYLAGQL